MNSPADKAFLLGLDGGSWRVLTPLMNEGYMPNLQKICAEGTSGLLHSTTPPYTAPAWVSCCTGMNPGKHGVFGFTTGRNGLSDSTLVSSRSVRAPKIWHHLNRAGKTVGLINIPITYPAEQVDGFMIPCFLTPEGKKDFTHPTSLYDELLQEIGAYIINVKIATRKVDTGAEFKEFTDRILFATQKRFEAMRVLWQKYSPDFLMIVFTCLDKIQHKFWKFLDRENPLYHSPPAKKARPALIKIYQLVDDIIGYIIKQMDDSTNLYIVSDHGFGPYEKRVYLNQWLEKECLLSLKRTRYYLLKFLRKVGLGKLKFSDRTIAVASNPIDDCINLPKTLFYCSDVYEQGIYFNHDARISRDLNQDYEGERNLLRDKLLSLLNPATGEQLIDDVSFREEVYWGPFVDLAPDLLLRIKDYGYLLNRSLSLRGGRLLQSVVGPEGCHRSEGIFAAYGRGIRKAKAVEASIFDITPTVLYNYGIPVPREMDGRVLNDIFRHEFQESTQIRYREEGLSSDMKETIQFDYAGSEESEIKSRLKDLGYLD